MTDKDKESKTGMAKFIKGQKVVLTPSGLFYHGKDLEGIVGVIEGEYDDGELEGLFMPSYWIGGELGMRLPKAMEGSKDVSRRVTEEDIRLVNSVRSTNAVEKGITDGWNAGYLARSRNAVEQKSKGIIKHCMIRTADGEVAEVAYIDEDGFVYFEGKDGEIRSVPADTVVRLKYVAQNVEKGTGGE